MLTSITFIHSCLMVTVPDDLSEEALSEIRDDVLNALQSRSVRGVIFDLSSVRVLDSHEFTDLLKLGRMTLLLGSESVFMGMRPGVVSSLIDIGFEDIEVKTFLCIEACLSYFDSELIPRESLSHDFSSPDDIDNIDSDLIES